MLSDTISRVAFAIQDEDIGYLKARRLAANALAALQAGDELGRHLYVAVAATAPATLRRP